MGCDAWKIAALCGCYRRNEARNDILEIVFPIDVPLLKLACRAMSANIIEKVR